MFSRWTRFCALVAALACGALTACDRSLQDTRSTEPRVISLSPALTRIVIAVGGANTLVGVDRFSSRLPGLERAEDLGGLFATDLERSVELQPTLVLAVGNREQLSYFDALRSRGIAVETFEGHTLEEVLESFSRVGRLVGREAEGLALAQKLRSVLSELADSRQEPAIRIAIVVALDPLYVVGGGSFVNELIAIAGAENVFASLPQPYARVGLEALAESAPAVLIDTTRSEDEAASARAHWERFSWVERVEVLPQGILTLPGPDLAEATLLLRDSLRP